MESECGGGPHAELATAPLLAAGTVLGGAFGLDAVTGALVSSAGKGHWLWHELD